MIFNAATIEMLQEGIWETLYMVVLSSAISYLIGIPLGIILVGRTRTASGPFPFSRAFWGWPSTCSGRFPSLFC